RNARLRPRLTRGRPPRVLPQPALPPTADSHRVVSPSAGYSRGIRAPVPPRSRPLASTAKQSPIRSRQAALRYLPPEATGAAKGSTRSEAPAAGRALLVSVPELALDVASRRSAG